MITTAHRSAAWTAFLAVIAVGHHQGTWLAGLGEVGDTRWADWVDLLLPWCVVTTAGLALLAVSAQAQIVGVVGLVAYVHGHGIHLAANSVATQVGGDTAFLWDELVGHAIWYSGLYLILGALLIGRPVAAGPGPLRLLLAVAVGVTLCTNAIGGHAVPLATVACTALVVLGWRRRQGNGVDVLLAAAVGLVSLAGYGVAVWLFGVSVSHT